MDDNDLTGSQKAAVFLMAMGEKRSNKLKLEMDKDEVEELRDATTSLGKVPSDIVENIISEYDTKRSALPMNQPQNADIRLQQEQAQAQAKAQPRRRAAQPDAKRRETPMRESDTNSDGTSPAVQHLTNIEV
jgi:flagellar motor switch protein FliG